MLSSDPLFWLLAIIGVIFTGFLSPAWPEEPEWLRFRYWL